MFIRPGWRTRYWPSWWRTTRTRTWADTSSSINRTMTRRTICWRKISGRTTRVDRTRSRTMGRIGNVHRVVTSVANGSQNWTIFLKICLNFRTTTWSRRTSIKNIRRRPILGASGDPRTRRRYVIAEIISSEDSRVLTSLLTQPFGSL